MNDFANRRILVVEDEIMIAMMIEGMLTDLGCEIVGPASKLEAAIALATEEALDAALLDVTIRGGQVFPVAEILRRRSIPFILASGYGDWALPEAFQGSPRLQKPFTAAALEEALGAICPPR
ncbi:MAG TPA: response regulator [Caulobacteraceae bacterium]|nr:response regulator [Caulobacteraceae bacterium]